MEIESDVEEEFFKEAIRQSLYSVPSATNTDPTQSLPSRYVYLQYRGREYYTGVHYITAVLLVILMF